MNFTCSREPFAAACVAASRAVPAHASLDVLKGLLIEAGKDGVLTVCGNDMEIAVSVTLEADVETPGAIVLNARMVSEMIRRTSGDVVSVQTDDRYNTTVVSDSASFQITALSAENYPDLPEVEGLQKITLPQSVLRRLINDTVFSVTPAEKKGVHTGVLFDVEPEKLTLVGLDGFRLALNQYAQTTNTTARFVVPGKSVSELERLLSDDEEAVVTLFVGARHLLASLEGKTLVTRLLEGTFINYRDSIPQVFTFEMTLPVKPMIRSLERIALLIDEKLLQPARFRFSEGALRISCKTPVGAAQDDLTGEGGGDLEIGFNHRYILEILRHMDCDFFTFKANGVLAACLLLPENDPDAVFMVLPVRIA